MSALGPPCGSSDSFHTTVFVFHLPQPLPFRPPDVCVGSVGVYSPKQVGPEVALLWCYWCQPSLQLSDFSSCRQGILAPKACKTHSDCEQSTARPCCPAVHHRWGDSLSKSCKYGAKLQAKRSSVSELGAVTQRVSRVHYSCQLPWRTARVSLHLLLSYPVCCESLAPSVVSPAGDTSACRVPTG